MGPVERIEAIPEAAPSFTKRWVVINSKPGLACITRLLIEYETERGGHSG